MSELKITKGKARVERNSNADWEIWAEITSTGSMRVARLSCSGTFDKANADLFAEALNVAQETGLTPRELADQRAKLLAVAVKYHGIDDPYHRKARPNCKDCAAIEEALGE